MAGTYTTDSPEWAALCEGFMQPDVSPGDYFEVETTCGTEIVPADVIGRTMSVHVDALLNYLEGKPLDPEECAECKTGWLARLSAPGYMDCTEWAAFDTEAEAVTYLIETFGES